MRSLVTIDEGEAVQIRSLLSHTVVPGLAEGSRYAIELAVRDFGLIHGHAIELGESLDTGCGPEGGHMGAGADHRRPTGSRRHRHELLRRGSGGLTGDQRGGAGNDLAVQHLASAHL